MIKMSKILFRLMFVVIILSVLMSILITMPISTNIAHASSDTTLSIDDLCEQYTNTKIPNNLDLEAYIAEFKGKSYPNNILPPFPSQGTLYANASSYSNNNGNYTITASGDDNITKIIPKQLFTQNVEKLYIGKAYGFYIDTRIKSNYNQSTIILFNVENFSQEDIVVDIKITPLVQLGYIYASNTISAPEFSYLTPGGSIGNTITYNMPSGGAVSPVVFTNPTNIASSCFAEMNTHKISDISFGGLVRNQNTLDRGDEAYDMYADNGYFITSNNYYYSGTKVHLGEEYYDVTNFADIIIDAALLLFDVITDAGTVLDIIDLALTAIDGATPESGDFSYNETNFSHGYSVNYFPTNRTGQINKFGQLLKAAMLILNSTNEDIMYFYNDDFARAQFGLGCTTAQYAQFVLTTGMTVYYMEPSETIKKDIAANPLYLDINEPEATSMTVGETENLYILPKQEQHFLFSTTFGEDNIGGQYEFNVGTNDVEVYLDGVEQTVADGKCILDLPPGEYNQIVVKNTSNNKLRGEVSINLNNAPSSQNITIQSGAYHIIRFAPDEGGAYTFSSTNAIITNAFTYINNVETRVESLTQDFVESDEISSFCNVNQSYYIVLYNNTSTIQTTSFVISQVTTIWGMGENTAIEIEPREHYTFYKFTPTLSTTSSYVIQFNNARGLQYIVRDENGVSCDSTKLSTGYLRIVNATAGKDIYIGIKSSYDDTITPIVSVYNGVQFVWRIYDENTTYTPDSNGVYHLMRGKSYKAEVWEEGVILYENVTIESDSDTMSGIMQNTAEYDITSQTLTLQNTRYHETTFRLAPCTTSGENVVLYDGYIITICSHFNPDDFSLKSVDYEDNIILDFNLPADTPSVNLKITGSTSAGTTYTITATANGRLATLMRLLYNRGAVGVANITIETANFRNVENADLDQLPINKLIGNINCDYVSQSSTQHHVANALQLYNIRYINNSSRKIMVDNDIDVSKLNVNWTPIATLNNNIDGGNHAILGMTIAITAVNPANYGFVAVNYAMINKLDFRNVNIICTDINSDQWINVGGVCGINHGTISLCDVTGSISANTTYSNVGGIVGANEGTISLCMFGDTDGMASYLTGKSEIGGIAGFARGQVGMSGVTNTVINFKISSSSHSVGGIAGYAEGCNFILCAVNTTTINIVYSGVEQNSYPRLGWLVGHLSNSTISSVGVMANNTGSTSSIRHTDYCYSLYNGNIGLMTGNSSYPQ